MLRFTHYAPMFLAERSSELEYFDRPAPEHEVIRFQRDIGRINRLFRFGRPFQVHLPHQLGLERCRGLSILDVGAGDGSLGKYLTGWAALHGWEWDVTSLDLTRRASLNGLAVQGSATALPFADGSYDAVIASQMTHHLLGEQEIIHHFREAWRVARQVVVISDLHRNAVIYTIVALVTSMAGCSKQMRSDAVKSVARGFRVPEWRAMAQRAGIPHAKVSIYCGARILLRARKSATTT